MSEVNEGLVQLPGVWGGATDASGETWTRRYAVGVVGQVIESAPGSRWAWSIVAYLPSGHVHVATYGEAPTADEAREAADSAAAGVSGASAPADVLDWADQLIRQSDARDLVQQIEEQKHRVRQVRRYIDTHVSGPATEQLTTMLAAEGAPPLGPLVWKLTRVGETTISFDEKNALELQGVLFTPEAVAEVQGYAVATIVDRRTGACAFGLRASGTSWARFESPEEFRRASERAVPWDEVELSEYAN